MTGVRQGENWSPLPFYIFLSDLESFLKTKYKGLVNFKNNIYSMLEEDDCVLYPGLIPQSFCLALCS